MLLARPRQIGDSADKTSKHAANVAGYRLIKGGSRGKGPITPIAASGGPTRAAAVLTQVEKGIDPLAAKAEEEQRREADRFETVIGEFVERHAKPNNRGWQRQDRDLRREFLPSWQDWPIGSIGRRDIIERLNKIADRTSPQRANRYLALIKRLFAWCVERGYIEFSPATSVKPPSREVSRDRVLTTDEIRTFWQCCDSEGWPFGELFRLLILTAQRLGEVSAMRWRDIDFDRAIWTVPAEIAKNGVANEVPLAPPAIAILKRAPSPRGGHVFPAQNGSPNPVSGFSKAKERLDREIAAARGGEPLTPWRLHDLRRAAASGMAELTVAPHVIERVLNHISGSPGGDCQARRAGARERADRLRPRRRNRPPRHHRRSRCETAARGNRSGRRSRLRARRCR